MDNILYRVKCIEYSIIIEPVTQISCWYLVSPDLLKVSNVIACDLLIKPRFIGKKGLGLDYCYWISGLEYDVSGDIYTCNSYCAQ